MEQLTKREADYLARFRGESHPINTQFGLEMVHKHYLIADDKVGHFCLSAKGADMLSRYENLSKILPDDPAHTDPFAAGDAVIMATQIALANADLRQAYYSQLLGKASVAAPDDVATLKARIIELEANHASALEVSRIKGEELAAAIAENEEYREALKPFADTANRYQRLKSATIIVTITELALTLPTGDYLTFEAFHRAAEVYAKFKGAGDE